MHTTPTKALTRFLQILDGSFPSGTFVHSFGLEPHVVLEVVKDDESLKIFLENVIIDQYQKMECVYVKKVFQLLEENRLPLLLKEDEKYAAMMSFEYAKASKTIGRNYLKHINFDIKQPIVQGYFKCLSQEKAEGNELTVLACYAYELGLDCDLLLLLWIKKSLINMATASLKITRIKPSQVQKLLFEFDEKIEAFIEQSSKNISNFNPLFEENIFKHINLEPKLFMT